MKCFNLAEEKLNCIENFVLELKFCTFVPLKHTKPVIG